MARILTVSRYRSDAWAGGSTNISSENSSSSTSFTWVGRASSFAADGSSESRARLAGRSCSIVIFGHNNLYDVSLCASALGQFYHIVLFKSSHKSTPQS